MRKEPMVQSLSRLTAAVLAAGVLLPATASAAAGDPDPTFGTNGVVTGPAGPSHSVASMLVLPSGRIITAGSGATGTPSGTAFLAHRFSADGALDTGFASGGTFFAPDVPGPYGSATSVLRQSGGGVVLVGGASHEGAERHAGMRLDDAGALDGTFGSGGSFMRTSLGRHAAGQALLLPDDSFVVPGWVEDETGAHMLLAAYDATGNPAGYNTAITTDRRGSGIAAVRQPDGRLVVVGSSVVGPGGDGKLQLARFLEGTLGLDTSFGTDGITLDVPPGTSLPFAGGAAVQPDGKIVVVGTSFADDSLTRTHGLVVRYHADGTRDTSFGSGGAVIIPFVGASPSLTQVVRQPDGKLLVAGAEWGGAADPASTAGIVLARLTAAGALDTSFGTGGRVVTEFPSTTQASAGGLALLADGRALAAATAYNSAGATGTTMLARYKADPPPANVVSTPGGPGGTGGPLGTGGTGGTGTTVGAGPALTIAGGRVRGGRVLLRVGCPAGTGGCQGRVVIRPRRGRGRLASARLEVPAGAKRLVRAGLTRAGRRAVRARARIPALAVGTARDAADNTGVTRVRLTLRR